MQIPHSRFRFICQIGWLIISLSAPPLTLPATAMA